MLKQDIEAKPRILFSCYYTRNREGEQFVPEHVFSYQESGTLTITNEGDTKTFVKGDFRFSRRNQLIKFNKQPPPGGEFRSVSVYLDQQTLKDFSREHGFTVGKHFEGPGVLALNADNLYKSYMDSLLPYRQNSFAPGSELQTLKQREAILLLLQVNPEMKDVLFDFSEPGKIDLEAFMEQNFHFNVQLSRYAYLTGRSLATFKRDFEKLYHQSPGKWLQQRRLKEAHYLIKEKGMAVSDVYLETGFEDLSHFSYAFKKAYGVSPSRLL